MSGVRYGVSKRGSSKGHGDVFEGPEGRGQFDPEICSNEESQKILLDLSVGKRYIGG